MKEVSFEPAGVPAETASVIACLATVLELSPDVLPVPATGEDPVSGWTTSRWLGGRGLGIARIADPEHFMWAGPWLARVRSGQGQRPTVVMYGVPSGVVWDPAGPGTIDGDVLEAGFLVAPGDVALASPLPVPAPTTVGAIETIAVFRSAGSPVQAPQCVRAFAGRGLEGDRYVSGEGTFPSAVAGSALTLIEAEVCDSFTPRLEPGEHRRNVVTRGIELNGLVGREFTLGDVPCRGSRLCEPCTVVQRYAGRPILRALVHRGGLRADILADGEIAIGDPVRPAPG